MKFPADGVITSLTEIGLVELGEDATEIAPGATVKFLLRGAHGACVPLLAGERRVGSFF